MEKEFIEKKTQKFNEFCWCINRKTFLLSALGSSKVLTCRVKIIKFQSLVAQFPKFGEFFIELKFIMEN